MKHTQNVLRTIAFLMLGILISPLLLFAAPTTIPHVATFIAARSDYPLAGQSTWYYSVTSGKKPSISHVTFELKCPNVEILGAGMWDGEHLNELMPKAGKPEPGSFPGVPTGDPTTGIVGLKFDLGFKDNDTRHYYFTVSGNYTPQPMRVALKAGKGFEIRMLDGPAQVCGEPVVSLSSIGDLVWLDQNANGVQDAGEAGKVGVAVALLSEAGEVLTNTVTDASGEYLFDKLVNGRYVVQFALPDGYLFTLPKFQGTNRNDDSDANQLTGKTDVIALSTNTVISNIDAGLVEINAALSLVKNGTYDPGELNPWAFCNPFGPAHAFNALIFGNFTATGGDTEDRLVVGGNATFINGYSVGYGVYGQPIADNYVGTVDMLIVGGDLADGNWGINGNIIHGGIRTGPTPRWMNNGNIVSNVTSITFRNDGNVKRDGIGMTFEDMQTNLNARSDAYTSLADRGVVSIDNVNPFYLTLTANDPVLNVFNLAAAIWNGTGKQILINAPSNSTVLINVQGEDIVVSNSSMVVEGVSKELILVHYVDAKKITIKSFTHMASVLAMHANAILAGGSIEGRAVFGGSVETSSGFEFHNFYFTGRICLDENNSPAPPSIAYTFIVQNTGNVPLYGVTVNDPLVTVNGAPITLASGATDTTNFTARLYLSAVDLAAGILTNTAEVVATTINGLHVTAVATHVEDYPDQESPIPPVIGGGSGKPDFVLRSVELVPFPSMVNTEFKAIVRISNEGDVAYSPGLIKLWSGSKSYNARPDIESDASTNVTAELAVGETLILEFPGLKASSSNGTYHAMAVVNALANIGEWSYGNNHGGATYTLEPLEVTVTPVAGGMSLTWNSSVGYYYFVERSEGLNQPFTDIIDNLPSTSPVNVYIDTSLPESGTAFYRVWGYRP